jgi:hypothetical protein
MNLEQHLKERHLDMTLHKPILHQESGVVTFLLFNLSGQIVGYQQYRPNANKDKKNDPKEGRYFTKIRKQTVSVFGVESLHLTPNVVFVTEGVFAAARLTSRGVSALAVLSNDPTQDCRNFLRCLSRKVVVVCDNDSAGRKLAKVGDVAVFTEDKDLGDSAESFVEQLIAKFC